MLPKFSLEVLHLQPENIVFVLAPVGIAVFLGLRSVEYFSDRYNKLVTISGAYVLMAASLIALGFTSTVAGIFEGVQPMNEKAARIAATIIFANTYGFALTVVLTMGRVLLNERVPLRMQGRIFAAQSILSNLTAIVPIVVAGVLADTAGVQPVLILAGIAALLAAAWSQARSSRLPTVTTAHEAQTESLR
jgi:MFS family permease